MRTLVNENNDFGHRLMLIILEQARRANESSRGYRHERDGDFLGSEQIIKKMEAKHGKQN